MDDHEIISHFLKDPKAGFEPFYKRFSGPLLRYIYRFTGSGEAAEEVLHDIFLELIEQKYSVSSNEQLKFWLFTVAKNKSLNALKKRQSESQFIAAEKAPATNLTLETELIEKQQQERLNKISEKLPIDLKQTWSLRQQGCDNSQISRQLQIPLGTVKSRFFRLAALLKKEFGSEY